MIGANDCMSENFDIKDTTGVYEKLIYTVAHKFSPKIITLCTVTQLGAFRRDKTQMSSTLENKEFSNWIERSSNNKAHLT